MTLRFWSRLIAASLLFCAASAHAEPSSSGQTGYIHMPSARIEPDGTFTLGYSFADPYTALYGNLSVLPFLEFTLMGYRIRGVPGFINKPEYGDYKDKRADVKLRLTREGQWLPEIAVGAQDFIGTRLFGAEYVVASKRLSDALDVSLGFGRSSLTSLGATNTGTTVSRNRLGGVFAGVRYHIADKLSLVLERDPIDYAREPYAGQTGIAHKRSNTSAGLEYRWGWLGAQASRQGSAWGINTYVQIPLNQREFIPKFKEPEPYTRLTPRPTAVQWREDHAHERAMRRALDAEGFGGVAIRFDSSYVLHLQLAHPRISQMSRAVGRAARIALLLSPLETREIRITYLEGPLPAFTYTFVDLDRLRRYFNGQITRQELARSVAIRHADPFSPASWSEALAGFDEERERPIRLSALGDDEGGHVLAFRRHDRDLGSLQFIPLKIGSTINDPSGFFQYQLFSELNYSRRIGERTFLDAGLTLRLYDTFKEEALINSNNSPLPHVRTDVAKYIASSRLRLNRLALSRYYHMAPRWYGRLSAGIYEMMFSGVGGQLLYLPERGHWAADLSLDAVRQRDYSGGFGHLPYSTVTAIGSFHYRLPEGFRTTLRTGKFLARDNGVRLELSRRFKSGVELGGWLTFTDNRDLNASGSLGKPYVDKGVFLSLPFEILLPKDTRARGHLAIAEWNRDVGKMVAAPGDLYGRLDSSLSGLDEGDGLSRFGDVDDDYDLPSLGTGRSLRERSWLQIARSDASSAVEGLTNLPAWAKIGLATAAVAGSTFMDSGGLKLANRLGNRRWGRHLGNVGTQVPLAAAAGAALAALDYRDARLSDTGVAAWQAGTVGLLTAEGLKYAIGRARPREGLGRYVQTRLSRWDSAMPSFHTTLAWAMLTPFAKEYDAPWLYGVAALTNLGRVAKREHWVSDTVAGALIGYGLGTFFWEQRSKERQRRHDMSVMVGPGQIQAGWSFD